MNRLLDSPVLAKTLVLTLLTVASVEAVSAAPDSASVRFETAVVHEDGQCALVSGLEFPAAPAAPVKTVWSWSERHRPQKRDPVRPFAPKETPESDWLTVEVFGHGFRSQRDRQTEKRDLPAVWVVAGPEELWKDVPEVCLPAWRVDPVSATVRIPAGGPSPWKLRAIGDGMGSWWIEAKRGERAARLHLAPARDTEVRMERLEEERAQPVAGATLELHKPGAGARGSVLQYWASYVTGEDGTVHIPSLPAAHEVLAVAAAPGHLMETYQGASEHLPARFVLDPGASLRGRVTDPEGRPLHGVEIIAFAWASPHVNVSLHHRTRTDEEGAWHLETLPPGTAAISARGEGLTSHTETVAVEESELILPTWILEPGIDLPVRVVDDSGAPVADASLVRGRELMAKTNEHGRAVISGVPVGRGLTVEARARGHLAETATLAPPYPEKVYFQLTRGFRIVGVFATTDGAPIEDAKISVRFGRAVSIYDIATDGGFEVFLPPGESAELRLSSPTSPEVEVAVEPGASGETRDLGTIRAPVGLVVTGLVLDRRSGEPVPGARVWTPRLSDRGDAFAWFQQDLLSAVSDSEGLFELRGLPRAPALLRLDAHGFARRQIEIEPPLEEPTVELGELWVAPGTEVVVVAEQEMPRDAVARLDLSGRWLEADMLTATFQDNRAVLSNVPPGTSRLTVVSGQDLLCEQTVEVQEEDSGPLEVGCEDDALEVAGLVLVGGEPAGTGRLNWFSRQDAGAAVIFRKSGPLGLERERVLGGGRPDQDVEVDADGRFQSRHLTTGTWEVIWLPDRGAASPPREVRLEADTASLLVEFPASTIRGRVVNTDGEPVVGARVRELANSAFTFSRDDGEFEIAGAPEGLLRLRARSGDLQSPVIEVSNTADRPAQPVELVLDDNLESRLTIQVVGVDGLPASGAFVFLGHETGKLDLMTSRVDGTAQAELVPPLPPRVRAAAFAQGTWAFGDWVRTPELHGRSLQLDIDEPGALRLASDGYSGPVSVVSENVWNLSALMLRIGKRLTVSPSAPLTLTGLPPGSYLVSQPSGDFVRISVREGKMAEGELKGGFSLTRATSPARR